MRKHKQHQWQRLTKLEKRKSLLYGPIDEIAWHDQNSDQQSHEVGQKQPNFFGVYDLVGNVREWLHTSTSNGRNASFGGSWRDAIHKDKEGWRRRRHKASAMSSIGLRLVRPTPALQVQYEPRTDTLSAVNLSFIDPFSTQSLEHTYCQVKSEKSSPVKSARGSGKALKKLCRRLEKFNKKYGDRIIELSASPITQRQWSAVMNRNPSRPKYDDWQPPIELMANSMSWNGAVRFANGVSTLAKLARCYRGDGTDRIDEDRTGCRGYRLPTQDELKLVHLAAEAKLMTWPVVPTIYTGVPETSPPETILIDARTEFKNGCAYLDNLPDAARSMSLVEFPHSSTQPDSTRRKASSKKLNCFVRKVLGARNIGIVLARSRDATSP